MMDFFETFDIIESHSTSYDGSKKTPIYTKEIDYILVRDEKGEARGVFRVPAKPFYSVKMQKRKRFPRLGLKWKRFFIGFLGRRERMEPITESQFESYVVFELPEFKTKQNIPPKNMATIAASCMGASGVSVGNALCAWFDWYISSPGAVLIVALGWGISLSIIAINIYRGKWKK